MKTKLLILFMMSLCGACNLPGMNSNKDGGEDGGAGTVDSGQSGPTNPTNPNDPNDPSTSYCGPANGVWTPPPPSDGTAECAADKNHPACQCDNVGQTAPCWPGKRINRNRGICRDGVKTCRGSGEFGQAWGECVGAILPSPSATLGAQACGCFSQGEWKLANTSPCFTKNSGGAYTGAVSTFVDGSGKARCPTTIKSPPEPEPGKPFSANTLKVDCQGQFQLCYTFKAGDADNPKPTDCVLARVCTETWYDKQGVEQALPDLPAWSSSDGACAQQFTTQGYAEMSVLGKSVYCENVSPNGAETVFNRIKYCPLICNTEPTRPECANCGNGANGKF